VHGGARKVGQSYPLVLLKIVTMTFLRRYLHPNLSFFAMFHREGQCIVVTLLSK
jgi:hypothetical protein